LTEKSGNVKGSQEANFLGVRNANIGMPQLLTQRKIIF